MREARPPDECPYPRPLPEGFADCALFHPVRFVSLSSFFEPLQPVLTCRHMEIGQVTTGLRAGAYYCRCVVGDADARRRAAARLDAQRAVLMRELADGIMAVVLEHWEALGAGKAHELAARSQEEHRRAGAEVRASAEVIRTEMRRRVAGPLRTHVERLGIRIEALLAVIDAGVADFESHGFTTWQPADHLLADLPPDVAAFLKPPAA
jgi:hypothetical protein